MSTLQYCSAVTKDGNNCSRKASTGETMCKQHLNTSARTLERNRIRKAHEEAYDAIRKKWAEENAKAAIKRGTDEQRAKFKADVLAAWDISKPLLTEDEDAYDGYNSDLEIEEEGVGICSTCGKTNYCVKVNHGQVFCTDNSHCFYPTYNWFHDDPERYPLEIPEEYRKD